MFNYKVSSRESTSECPSVKLGDNFKNLRFESPVDCNNTQTYLRCCHPVQWFESPVDCNNTQTLAGPFWFERMFESPVDCNNTQT